MNNSLNNTNDIDINSIQKGFSHLKLINPIIGDTKKYQHILLVEGKTDAEFYKRFLKSDVLIFYANKDAYNKEIDKIPEYMLQGRIINKQNIYVILDKDYKTEDELYEPFEDYLNKLDPSKDFDTLKNTKYNEWRLLCTNPKKYLNKFIWITDANSLETMMLKYCDTEDKKDEFQQKLFKLHEFDYTTLDFSLNKNIIDYSIDFARKIGCIRKQNFDNNTHLKFDKTRVIQSDIIKETRYYYDYIYPEIDDSETIYDCTFDFEDWFQERCNASYCQESEFCLNENYDEIPWYDLCQGHDLFNLIESIILQIMYLQIGKIKIEFQKNVVSPFALSIIENYPLEYFSNSKLKKWLKENQLLSEFFS